MKIHELPTPCILLDMGVLERNIEKYQILANKYGKELWPMVKTHKSTALAHMQRKAGATGFLCGTLDECEALCDEGLSPLMYAYPPAGKASVERIIALGRKTEIIVRFDSFEAAAALNAKAAKAGIKIGYTLIIDCGLHRFGVLPEEAAALMVRLEGLGQLIYRGISSHSGQVYGAQCPEDVPGYAREETEALSKAVKLLSSAGFAPELVTTGSTPTFVPTVADENIGIYHPGNYVFNDCIQISNGSCREEDCALTVLASVISNPQDGVFICDAGAKCLGLDKGAHGNSSISGHGRLIGCPEVTVSALSEEVGKLRVSGTTTLKVGELIRIIPNHACSTANLTDYFICCRGDDACGIMEVDIRGNSKIPTLL